MAVKLFFLPSYQEEDGGSAVTAGGLRPQNLYFDPKCLFLNYKPPDLCPVNISRTQNRDLGHKDS